MTRPSMLSIAAQIAMWWPVDPGGEPIKVSDIRGPSRGNREVRPRQAFYAAAKAAGYSTPRIIRFCNRRNHATVIYGARRHAEREGALSL